MTIPIRPIRADDARAFLDLLLALDGETRFMLLEPGERSTDPQVQRARLEQMLQTDNQMVFVAEREPGELVGFVGGYGGAYRRNHACVHIVAGVRADCSGQGLGARLFAALEEWARAWGAHRLELTVMTHNTRALALYHKMGFAIEGTLRGSLCVDGRFVDQYQMSKLLG